MGKNPLWGSKANNEKGKTFEDSLSQEGLCIITYLYSENGFYATLLLLIDF